MLLSNIHLAQPAHVAKRNVGNMFLIPRVLSRAEQLELLLDAVEAQVAFLGPLVVSHLAEQRVDAVCFTRGLDAVRFFHDLQVIRQFSFQFRKLLRQSCAILSVLQSFIHLNHQTIATAARSSKFIAANNAVTQGSLSKHGRGNGYQSYLDFAFLDRLVIESSVFIECT